MRDLNKLYIFYGAMSVGILTVIVLTVFYLFNNTNHININKLNLPAPNQISNTPIQINNNATNYTRAQIQANPDLLNGMTAFSDHYYQNNIYYLSDGRNRFYEYSIDDKGVTPYSDPLAATIQGVFWSPNARSAVIQILNNKYQLNRVSSPFLSLRDADDTLTNWYYNFASKTYFQLPTNAIDFSFSDANKLAFITKDSSTLSSLNVLQNSQSANSAQKILSFKSSQDTLSFLDEDHILLTDSTGNNPGIFIIDLKTKSSTLLANTNQLYGIRMSPNKQQFLGLLKTSDGYTSLVIYNLNSKLIEDLQIQCPLEDTAWEQNNASIVVLKNNSLEKITLNPLTTMSVALPSDLVSTNILANSLLAISNNVFFINENLFYRVTF